MYLQRKELNMLDWFVLCAACQNLSDFSDEIDCLMALLETRKYHMKYNFFSIRDSYGGFSLSCIEDFEYD